MDRQVIRIYIRTLTNRKMLQNKYRIKTYNINLQLV